MISNPSPQRVLLFLACLAFGLLFTIDINAWSASVARRTELRGEPEIEQFGWAPALRPHNAPANPPNSTFPALLNALDVLQSDFFTVWEGLYPTGIDWTSAVVATHVAATLSTLSTSYSLFSSPVVAENVVNKYFGQLTGYYFGQDAFALRQEANDDMLWVVLGWLETIKFVNLHSDLHYKPMGWHGKQYIPAFAHRARVFWDLASQGWNETLCKGGMIWSPYLLPYKNAITNELYISASISMYLYFPGDNNTSPFSIEPAFPARDAKYLAAAVEAYRWIQTVNMTDSVGLYVDGYHISNLLTSNNTVCDQRNEQVYTYNQGVLLSGQRGLYEATAARSYLDDGHALIRAVINATGFNLTAQHAYQPFSPTNTTLGAWYGLGRSGIMEDTCDYDGSCSQDGQTFKGIFFNHLTLFCKSLPSQLVDPQGVVTQVARAESDWHRTKCGEYVPWLRGNVRAALGTRDEEGVFGEWWAAPDASNYTVPDDAVPGQESVDAVDYRNLGVPFDAQWRASAALSEHRIGGLRAKDEQAKRVADRTGGRIELNSGNERRAELVWKGQKSAHQVPLGNEASLPKIKDTDDLNDRGRGRTLESQSGGLALVRALWELAQ